MFVVFALDSSCSFTVKSGIKRGESAGVQAEMVPQAGNQLCRNRGDFFASIREHAISATFLRALAEIKNLFCEQRAV